MISRIIFIRIVPVVFALGAFATAAFSQSLQGPNPRQEKLLNGLKVLMWNDAKADKVSLKLRVHSGSAFDPQGQEGVMRLLAESIFPDKEAREFFTDELGGSLEIVSNHDYIQVNATAKPSEFLNVLETVANAVNNLSVDKQTTARLKSEQTDRIMVLHKDPAYLADQAAAKRLLGNYPYGRPANGTVESIGKIDFADILFAKERFFTADNATIAVSGNFDPALGFRAVRRYFGTWLKSDRKTPFTFKQPDEPDTSIQSVKLESGGGGQVRHALRGIARNDKDFAAIHVLNKILEARLKASAGTGGGGNAFVRHDGHVLPGLIIFGYTSSVSQPQTTISRLLAGPVTGEEFARYKAETLAELRKRAAEDWWLDADTYKLTSVADEARSYDSVTLADVQRVAARLSKNPVVTLSFGPAVPLNTTSN